jgi:trans-aconitate methyltransferase
MSMLFDEYAADYDIALQLGLSISGESQAFFVRERLNWLKKCLEDYGAKPQSVLDFGCGNGTVAPFLLDLIASKVIGVDVSEKCLRNARKVNDPARTEFSLVSEYRPSKSIDLAFCNGVFHHISLEERSDQLSFIFDSLQNGAFFAFWENNPWSPGARIVMKRIPFDIDAKTLTATEARRLLKRANFHVLRTDYFFIFPYSLRWMRPIETLFR